MPTLYEKFFAAGTVKSLLTGKEIQSPQTIDTPSAASSSQCLEKEHKSNNND